MHRFLHNNRDELISRCKAKVALRPHHDASEAQLNRGVPLFLDQLTQTLFAEQEGKWASSVAISGPSGGDAEDLSEMGVSAKVHGKELLELGFSIDQVVHAYGDLCQSITDLAVERDAPFTVNAFRTLNRCLDNAIADAVTEFSAQRDLASTDRDMAETKEKLGAFAHELQSHLSTSLLAFEALETGKLSISGSTGAMLKRSLQSLKNLLQQTLLEAQPAPNRSPLPDVFSLAEFVAESAKVASLYAVDTGCTLWLPSIDPRLGVRGCRELLAVALNSLLHNAFKFTKPRSEITLHGYAAADRILIEVRDHCGGLPAGATEQLLQPSDASRPASAHAGLGLTVAAAGIKADGGVLSVRSIAGVGCVFAISLPRERWSERLPRADRRSRG